MPDLPRVDQYAKESIQELHPSGDTELAPDRVTELGSDLKEADHPFKAVPFDRTLARGKGEITTWHMAGIRDGPTEAVDNRVKRVERSAIGSASFRRRTIEPLLYVGEPNGDHPVHPAIRPSGHPPTDPSTHRPSVGRAPRRCAYGYPSRGLRPSAGTRGFRGTTTLVRSTCYGRRPLQFRP